MSFTAGDITSAAVSHVDETAYGAVGSVTKCNLYVQDVIEAISQQSRPEFHALANDQFDNLTSSPDWDSKGFSAAPQAVLDNAFSDSNSGKLIVVAWKNSGGSGHIAIIVPAAAKEASTAWGFDIPFIAQAGKMNPRNQPAGTPEASQSVFASLKLSWGFKVSAIPQMEVFYYNK